MKLYTSYFAKYRDGGHGVAISATVPDGFKGKHIKELAPSYELLMAWKDKTITREYFVNKYKRQLAEMGDISGYFMEGDVLLCWEGKDKFCHRHILAEYLQETAGVEVSEL